MVGLFASVFLRLQKKICTKVQMLVRKEGLEPSCPKALDPKKNFFCFYITTKPYLTDDTQLLLSDKNSFCG